VLKCKEENFNSLTTTLDCATVTAMTFVIQRGCCNLRIIQDSWQFGLHQNTYICMFSPIFLCWGYHIVRYL